MFPCGSLSYLPSILLLWFLSSCCDNFLTGSVALFLVYTSVWLGVNTNKTKTEIEAFLFMTCAVKPLKTLFIRCMNWKRRRRGIASCSFCTTTKKRQKEETLACSQSMKQERQEPADWRLDEKLGPSQLHLIRYTYCLRCNFLQFIKVEISKKLVSQILSGFRWGSESPGGPQSLPERRVLVFGVMEVSSICFQGRHVLYRVTMTDTVSFFVALVITREHLFILQNRWKRGGMFQQKHLCANSSPCWLEVGF